MADNLTEFLDDLKNLIEKAPDALSGFHHVELGTITKLKQIYSQLSFLSTGQANTVESVQSFAPVTSFMGEDISRPKPIKIEDLSAAELERKIFKEKGERLRAGFADLTNEQILESYMNDQAVVRLVAKWSGLENYKTGTVDGQFIDDIRAAMQAQEEMLTKKAAEQNAIANQ